MAQGDWQYDGTSHWKLCACGAKVGETAHTGGTATCTASAVCEVCGQAYGEKNPNHHTGSEAWMTTDTTHTKVYRCCQMVIEAETGHTWEDGKCSVCQYGCKHQGGTATCSQLAQCEICGSLYGSYDENNHKAAAAWTQEKDKHYHICEYGCGTHLDETPCSGGTATCTALAVCETCQQTYGEVTAHKLSLTEKVEAACVTAGKEAYYTCEVCGKYFEDEAGNKEIENLAEWGIIPAVGHKAGTEWKFDGTNHWNECISCGAAMNKAAHDLEWVTDKEATATEAGSRHEKCVVCGYAKDAVKIPATGETTEPTKPATPADTSKPADTNKPADTSKPANAGKSTNTSKPVKTTTPDGTAVSKSPQTGDGSNMILWMVMMLAAGTGLTGTAFYSRKKKYNR